MKIPPELEYDLETLDEDDLEAAADMYDRLVAGTFYEDEERARGERT